MNIPVVYVSTFPERVSVEMNGICNHESYEYVEMDFGSPDMSVGDYVESWQTVGKCERCDALYDIELDIWEIK